jgi:hypothetical protein
MYTFKVSTRKNKKYDAYKNNKYLLSFGSKINQHYYDKIGFYKNLNHLDNKRRDNYYKRFGKKAKPDTAKWFSHNYLW